MLINVYVASPDPDPNPRGRGQLPNPNECNSTLMEVSSVSPRVPPGQVRSGMIFLCEIPYPRGQIIV